MVRVSLETRMCAAWTGAALALVMLAMPAQAQSPPGWVCPAPPGGPPGQCAGPAAQPTGAGPNVGAGNPINVISGNKYQHEVDLAPLPGVLGLELVRHYNSAHSSATAPNGILGRGWKLSYETELFVLGGTVQIAQADGARFIFSRDPKNPSVCGSADPSRGQVLIGRDAQGEHYTWVWNDGRRLSFDAKGKLTQILAPTGEFVTLQYDAEGHLLKVTDPQGRSLRLNYLETRANKGERFAGVQSIDTPVGRYVYEYGSALPQGSPHHAQTVLANLVKVKLPTHHEADTKAHAYTDRGVSSSSVSRIYHYEDAKYPTLLTGVSVLGSGSDGKLMNQRLVTWAYDARGRAALSVKGNAQDGIEKVTLHYKVQASLNGKPGQTVLTNSLGQSTTYTHQIIGGEYRLLEVRGAGCSTCGEMNLRYRYDSHGRLLSTVKLDDNGKPVYANVVDSDVHGRITRTGRIDFKGGKAQPPRWLVRYEYETPTHEQGLFKIKPYPTLIARPSLIVGKEHTIQTAYNDAGQPTRVTEAGYSPIDDRGQPTPLGTSIGRTTTYSYARVNGRSLLVQMDGPLPNGPKNDPGDSDITRLTYDVRGDHVTSVSYPTGLNASFTHDDAGRLVQYTPVDAVPVRQTLDTVGRPVTWQRGSVVISAEWDAAGRLIRLRRNDGNSVAAVYDAAGRLTATVDADGSRREIERDAEGQVLKALWRDAAGDVPFEPLEYEYDVAGRRTADNRGTRFGYDSFGRLTSTSDALHRESRLIYDTQGRLAGNERRIQLQPRGPWLRTSAGEPAGTDRVFTQLLYRNDDSAEPMGVVAANGARTVSDLDDFGRTVKTSSPDSGITLALYDAADRPVEIIDAAGSRTHIRYDALGRLVSRTTRNAKTPQDTETVTLRYHGAYLLERANAHQADRYRWDGSGRLVEQGTSIVRADGSGRPAHEFATRYSYDNVGRLAEKRLPDGLRIVPVYGPYGRPSKLLLRYPNGTERAIVEDLRGDAVRGLREVVFGNGTATAYVRDKRGRLQGVATVARDHGNQLAPLYAQRIVYDTVGRVVAIERDGKAERFAYDGLDRLIQIDSPHEYKRLEYDAVGNRTRVWDRPPLGHAAQATAASETKPQQSWSYRPESNRLLQIELDGAKKAQQADDLWQYDQTGNPTSIAGRSYGYGANGRLQQVVQGRKALVQYRYNAAGERISKRVEGTGSAETYYLYAQNKLVAEADDQGRITAHYVYLGHTALAKIETRLAAPANAAGWSDTRPSAWQRWLQWKRSLLGDADDEPPSSVGAVRVLYLHADHLGTPRLATDAQQRVVWRASYQSFGAATANEDPDGDGHPTRLNLRLPGQYFDAETGTHYNYFRDYDPQLGRYLQSDPIGLDGGVNTYAYADANPMSAVDPLGLAWEPADESVPGWLNRILVGQAVHSMFSEYVRGLDGQPGEWQANNSYDGTFNGLRPDAFNTVLRQVWELKPISNRDREDLYRRIALPQVASYLASANRPRNPEDPRTVHCGGWTAGATGRLFANGDLLGYIQLGVGPLRRVYQINMYHDTHPGNTGLVFYTADLIENPTGEFFEELLRELARHPPWILWPPRMPRPRF